MKKDRDQDQSVEPFVPLSRLEQDLPPGIKLSRHTLATWVRRGVRGIKLNVKWVGGRIYARRSDLRSFLEQVESLKERVGV